MTKKKEDKLAKKKQLWVRRTAAVLGVSEETTRHLLSVGRQQSIRINPLVAKEQEVIGQLKELGWSGKPFEWSKGCYTVENGLQAIRDSELAQNGSLYIQNAASWLPVLALDPQPGEHILDVCAAPGGKTSHIAALTGDQTYITANDNSRPRLAKLRSNLTRLGVRNVDYTLFDAMQLGRRFEGKQYDKILLDAPCSGEGMMSLGWFPDSTPEHSVHFLNEKQTEAYDGTMKGASQLKNVLNAKKPGGPEAPLQSRPAGVESRDKDFTTWSVAHIKRLQQLQKRILTQAWQLLKPGGTLVYSTCTMAPEENEAVIDYLLRRNPDADIRMLKLNLDNRVAPVLSWNGKTYDDRLRFALRLIPSPQIEAFFICKLVKNSVQYDA